MKLSIWMFCRKAAAGRHAPQSRSPGPPRADQGANQVRARLLVRDAGRRDAGGRRGRLEHIRARRARRERGREDAQRRRRAVRRGGRADPTLAAEATSLSTLMVAALTRAAVVARERRRADRVARRRADGPNAFVEWVKPIEDMIPP